MGCCESTTHCDHHHSQCYSEEESCGHTTQTRVGYQPLQKSQNAYIIGTQPPPFIPPSPQQTLPAQYQYQYQYPQQQQYYGPPPSLHQTSAVYEVPSKVTNYLHCGPEFFFFGEHLYSKEYISIHPKMEETRQHVEQSTLHTAILMIAK